MTNFGKAVYFALFFVATNVMIFLILYKAKVTGHHLVLSYIAIGVCELLIIIVRIFLWKSPDDHKKRK